MKIDFEFPIDNQYHQFCPMCHSEHIERILQEGNTYYRCVACHKISPRMLVLDPKVLWWVDRDTKEYWHESVGIFVFNKNNEALFFERIIYPFAFTVPAGHLDVDEKPERAVQRELYEETGIRADKIKLFSEEDIIGDECRRGADNHRWHLYVTKQEKNDTIKINDEGLRPVWMSLPEALTKKLTVPVEYFIRTYGDTLFV